MNRREPKLAVAPGIQAVCAIGFIFDGVGHARHAGQIEHARTAISVGDQSTIVDQWAAEVDIAPADHFALSTWHGADHQRRTRLG